MTAVKKSKNKSYPLTMTLVDILRHLYGEGVKDAVVEYKGVTPRCGCQPGLISNGTNKASFNIDENGICYFLIGDDGYRHQPFDLATMQNQFVIIRGDIDIGAVEKRLDDTRVQKALEAYARLKSPTNYDEGDFVRFKTLGEIERYTASRPPFMNPHHHHNENNQAAGTKMIFSHFHSEYAVVLVCTPYSTPEVRRFYRDLLEKDVAKPKKIRNSSLNGEMKKPAAIKPASFPSKAKRSGSAK